MDSVSETLEEVRRLMSQGQTKKAADSLAFAVSLSEPGSMHQPEMRSLAEQGRARAFIFGRRRWDAILESIDALQEQEPRAVGQ
jgi:hypothetical protein